MNPADVVSRIGWLYQAGGAGPYLSIAARAPGVQRADVDACVASGALRIVTGVRGCTLLVPERDVALARAAGARAFSTTVQAILQSGEIDARTLDGVVDNVDAMLDFVGVDPPTIRSRAGGVPALGPTSRKLGFATALPIALRLLESIGRAERVPANGRLDSDAYVWRHPRDVDAGAGPTPGERMSTDLAALAKVFFGWDGGADRTIADLAAWLECPTRAVLGLATGGPPHAAFPFMTAYLPVRDPWVSLRRNGGDLVAPEHRSAPVVGPWKDRSPVGPADSLRHHSIVHDGHVVGIWEWSPREGLVSGFFAEPPEGWARAARATASFIQDQLGDVFIDGRDDAAQRKLRVVEVRGCVVAELT